MKSRNIILSVIVATFALAGCSGSHEEMPDHTQVEGHSIEVAGPWVGENERAFKVLLSSFERETGVNVDYVSLGGDLPAVLRTRLAGKRPPDVAILPEPGLIRQFGRASVLKPLSGPVVEALDKNFATSWKQFGSYEDRPYGVYLKAENKSAMWYNEKLLRQAWRITTGLTGTRSRGLIQR